MRFGDKPAQWFMDLAKERDDMQFELLDLRDYNLPFFNEVASNAWVPTQDGAAKRRPSAGSKSSGNLTRYVIITPEYNHGPPAVLKNALDQAYVEWVRKPVAFVGYGSVGGRGQWSSSASSSTSCR